MLLRLATRSSPLAMIQARTVAARLRRAWPGLQILVVPAIAGADRDLRTPLYAFADVGIFVKEVQALVLNGEADVGVHSCKDLPTTLPTGLCLAAILPRDDPRDALIGCSDLASLPPAALIGTSSLRRQEQLRRLRPDLRFCNLRGNVQTRLAKLAAGEATATVMAMAGLQRLHLLRAAKAIPLDPWSTCVSAPAQGAVACDARSTDHRTRHVLAALTCAQTARAITMERAVLSGIGGGCALPLGCLAVRSVDGRWRLRARMFGSPASAPDQRHDAATSWFEFDRTGASDSLVAQCLDTWHGYSSQRKPLS